MFPGRPYYSAFKLLNEGFAASEICAHLNAHATFFSNTRLAAWIPRGYFAWRAAARSTSLAGVPVYELNQIELLRDVFVWAYERSCQRYLAITQTMIEPDPLKIRYREALILAVQAVVKGLRQPSQDVITELAKERAAAADQAAFAQMLTTALAQLHEGSIARYRLRRSEFQAWEPVRDRR